MGPSLSSLKSPSAPNSSPQANPASSAQRQLLQLAIKGVISGASLASNGAGSSPASMASLASQSLPVSNLVCLASSSVPVSLAGILSLKSVKKSSRSVTTHNSSYKVQQLDPKLVNALNSRMEIVRIVKLQRKLESGAPHHETLIQTLYNEYVISFHQDGIDALLVGGLEQYCKESKCEIVEQAKGNFPIERVMKFMKEKENKMYDLLEWNCLNYADELFKAVTK